jgi:hypothetical protein
MGTRACDSTTVQENSMFAQVGANSAAVHSVAVTYIRRRFRLVAGAVALSVALGGCLPATAPLIGADPADPTVKAAPVGYQSGISPYTSLRPTAPKSWREQNERVAPAPKSGQ